MTYNSKKYITGMAAGAATAAAYIIYAGTGNAPLSGDIQLWARLMLIFIGIGVVAQIIVQIAFHVVFAVGVAVKEHDKEGEYTKKLLNTFMIEDERDKLIGLKSTRIGYLCTGGGSVAALIFLAAGASYVVALHIIAAAGAAGSFAEGCANVFYNERGVRNG